MTHPCPHCSELIESFICPKCGGGWDGEKPDLVDYFGWEMFLIVGVSVLIIGAILSKVL
jgi:hypothetical protein